MNNLSELFKSPQSINPNNPGEYGLVCNNSFVFFLFFCRVINFLKYFGNLTYSHFDNVLQVKDVDNKGKTINLYPIWFSSIKYKTRADREASKDNLTLNRIELNYVMAE